MEIPLKYLGFVLLVIGIALLFIHLGIFVFIYLPACAVLASIIFIRWKKTGQKSIRFGKKTKSKKQVEKISKYVKFRKILGSCVLVTILLTPLLPLLWGGMGPLIVVMFINPQFAAFTIPGIIIGLYFLKSKKVRRLIGVALLILTVPLQFATLLPALIMLSQGQTSNAFLLPMIFLVPASIIYATAEPAKKE